MRPEYIGGVVIIVILLFMAYWLGGLRGDDKGYKRGYDRGYSQGRQATFDELKGQPFRVRPGKPALPRPNSAGTVRVHRARIRNDRRPYEERPDQLIYPRTKMTRPENFESGQ